MMWFRILVALICAIAPLSSAIAEQRPSTGDLTQISLEELLDLRITSVGRKEQRLGETAAAVYVVTQDDIRRSGIRTLAELLRLVPGVHVARANGSAWAMGVRGFSDVYADKLLVLIDGRSIYNRNFSGVFWDMEDLFVDDIDHIEVIRGPGGAEWGANAVNGVINVITKSAAATKGTLARVGTGTDGGFQAAARYGGSAGNATYRLTSQWTNHAASRLDGRSANDRWTAVSNAARVDWSRNADELMLQGSLISSQPRPMWFQLRGPTARSAASDSVSDRSNAAAMARWTRNDAIGGTLRVQAFFTRLHMAEISMTESERIGDIDAQYRTAAGSRHDLVFGGGYRHARTAVANGTFSYSVTPDRATSVVTNLFLQDEITIVERFTVTLGGKVEHETQNGWSVQPTARAAWTVAPDQHVWTAVSRAVRTPSGSDRGIDLKFAAFAGADGRPVVMGVAGNPFQRSETLTHLQAGYRFQTGGTVTVDIAAFHGRYHQLQSAEPLAPVVRESEGVEYLYLGSRFDNLLDATTAGAEVAGQWAVNPSWLLKGSYSGLQATPRPSPLSREAGAGSALGNTPVHQWQAHSTTQLGSRSQITASLFHAGRLNNLKVPAYTRADASLEIGATSQLSIVVSGRDLLRSAHTEFPSYSVGMQTTSIPRSASVQLIWRQ